MQGQAGAEREASGGVRTLRACTQGRLFESLRQRNQHQQSDNADESDHNAQKHFGKDLIVSDVMMPGIDGFEFAQTVRGLNQDIPILFMTARDDFQAKMRGFQIGIDDFMVKPINLDELLLRITALLRRAKLQSSKRLTPKNTTFPCASPRSSQAAPAAS